MLHEPRFPPEQHNPKTRLSVSSSTNPYFSIPLRLASSGGILHTQTPPSMRTMSLTTALDS